MTEAQQARLEFGAAIFKALAHPARLAVVQRLAEGPQCVRELTELVGSDMSTVSRHLGVLKNAGVVLGEKRGNLVVYRLQCPCMIEFLDCIESAVRESVKNRTALLT